MKKKDFLYPMKTGEKVFGFLYLPIHIFAMAWILALLGILLNRQFGISVSSVTLNVVCYIFGVLLILIFMHHFLKASFSDLCDNGLVALGAMVLGYLMYMAMTVAINWALSYFVADLTNPNSQEIETEVKQNYGAMLAVAVLLAPILEETLFRGVVFGSIRKKSRFLAYLVSTLLFAFYHLWQYLFFAFDWHLLLYLMEYLPGSIALAWCYEKGRSIWASVFLHMLINFLSLYATIHG